MENTKIEKAPRHYKEKELDIIKSIYKANEGDSIKSISELCSNEIEKQLGYDRGSRAIEQHIHKYIRNGKKFIKSSTHTKSSEVETEKIFFGNSEEVTIPITFSIGTLSSLLGDYFKSKQTI